jgi:PAS domain S-box-containing protein
MEAWSSSLKLAVDLVMSSGFPMALRWGPDFILIYNDGYKPILGDKHPWALGLPAREAWSEVWPQIEPVHLDIFSGRRGAIFSEDMLLRIQRRGGQPEDAHFTLSYSPVPDAASPTGVGGVHITAVETTEAVRDRSLAEQERARLKQMFEQGPSFMAILEGPEHRFQLANAGYTKLVGNRPVLGLTVAEALPDAVAQGYLTMLDGVFRSGEPVSMSGARFVTEATATAPAREAFLDFMYQPLKDADGNVTGIFVEGIDVTERHLTYSRSRALAELGDRIRDIEDPDELAYAAAEILGRLFEVSRAGYGVIDSETETIRIERDWNMPGVTSLAGVLHFRDYGSYIEDLKRGTTVVVTDAEKDPRTAAGADALKAISAQSFVNMPVTEQGGFVALLYLNNAEARAWSSEELAFIREVAERTRTAVERRRAEAELRASEANFRTLTRAMPNQAWTAQANGMLDWFNEQVYDYSGAPMGSLDGANWTVMVHPDDVSVAAARWADALKSGETYEAEFRLRRADQAYRWHIARAVPVRDAEGAIVRWIGTNTDIQAQKEANEMLEQRVEERTAQLMTTQAALRQSQKMEAVGQLTGGIAHDFNNMLAIVIAGIDIAQRRLKRGDAGVEQFLDGAREGAKRAATLTQRLLAFSRQSPLSPKVISLNELVTGISELLQRTLGERIELETALAGGLWRTHVDPAGLESAVLNLAVNARDAMPEGGKLTLETANVFLDEHYTAREVGVAPGQYVMVAVTDVGEGMSPEVLDKAFDPFFTTKPVGKGTGLGLSMVYGFAKQSGGHVRIYSEPGRGTSAKIYLPRHFGAAEDEATSVRGNQPMVPAAGGETILVVEDDERVRQMSRAALLELGYTVHEATSGEEALQVFDSLGRIDAVFTDIVMGGMTGRQLADALRRKKPKLKVLFTTGYTRNAVVHNGVLDAGVALLTKPFTVEDLAAKLRSVLDSE